VDIGCANAAPNEPRKLGCCKTPLNLSWHAIQFTSPGRNKRQYDFARKLLSVDFTEAGWNGNSICVEVSD
jgi:hypothetical protein